MITSYQFARACYQSSKFLLCINLILHRETLLYHERLLCSMKNCFASRKIVVFHEKLFCITKDCCVPWKIVLYHERLMCTVKNCFVSRKIVVYPAQYWVVFCPCGPPYKLDLRGQKIKQHTHANMYMYFVVLLFIERTESTDIHVWCSHTTSWIQTPIHLRTVHSFENFAIWGLPPPSPLGISDRLSMGWFLELLLVFFS